jgi:hypothetical protein
MGQVKGRLFSVIVCSPVTGLFSFEGTVTHGTANDQGDSLSTNLSVTLVFEPSPSGMREKGAAFM